MLWKSKDTAIKLKTHSDYCYRCSTTGQLHKLLFPSISISKSFLIFRNYRFKLCSHFFNFCLSWFDILISWRLALYICLFKCHLCRGSPLREHPNAVKVRLLQTLSLWSVLTEQSIVDRIYLFCIVAVAGELSPAGW